MIVGAFRRPSGNRLKLLGAAAFLVAFGAWAIASPVGATPDEDFHLASIWCSHGTRPGICEPGPTADSRLIPAQLPGERCYSFKPDVSAACQWSQPTTGMVATSRGNFDGLYPPVFYWFEGLFVGKDVGNSVILMRAVNALLFVGLIAALYVLVPVGLRRALLGGTLVTVVPLAMFLVPSINPSSWGLLAASTLLVAMLGFVQADDKRRRIGLGVIAAVSFIMGAGSRTDAALFAVIAAGAVVILTIRLNRRALTALIMPAALAVVAVPAFLSARQSNIADAATSAAPFTLNRVIDIALDIPNLWMGALGGWGLGWLDTYMRPIVTVGSWGVFSAVVFIGLTGAGFRRAAAAAAVALAALAVPTYIQLLTGYPVGSVVQPRYILPLLTIMATTVLARIDGAAFRLTIAQRWALVLVLAVANMVALHDNIRRYVTGTDVPGLDLNHNAEWWWSIPISPMSAWLLGAVAFAVGAVLITKEFTVAAAATEGTALPAAKPVAADEVDPPAGSRPEPSVSAPINGARARHRITADGVSPLRQ